jgi:hypothetical protein
MAMFVVLTTGSLEAWFFAIVSPKTIREEFSRNEKYFS